jgi:L-fuconolactonase
MIIDSHCHAWRLWPYQPPVPDSASRAKVEQLLFEMDKNGVDRALIVCARIEDNPDNNDYIAAAVRANPGRLSMVADVDCQWWPSYHTPGAADRLRRAASAYPMAGFTHYVRGDDDGSWYLSDEGTAFFGVAQDLGLIASMAIVPRLHWWLDEVAERFPGITFLVHHMGHPKADEAPPYENLGKILHSARLPNIHLKLSGFHYSSPNRFEYPYADSTRIVQAIYDAYGPARLHWGSDFPVVGQFLTYRHTLDAVRVHCPFIPKADLDVILGTGLASVLAKAPHAPPA